MNENKNNGQDDYHSNAKLGMLGLLALGALVSQKEFEIKFWIYENMIYLILAGCGILALAGSYLWYRVKKKEKAYFENLKKLKGVQSQKSDRDYYQRKDPRHGRNPRW